MAHENEPQGVSHASFWSRLTYRGLGRTMRYDLGSGACDDTAACATPSGKSRAGGMGYPKAVDTQPFEPDESQGGANGGDGGTVVKGMDMRDGRDRGLLRTLLNGRTAKKRAHMMFTVEELESFKAALVKAKDLAIEKGDPRAINGCVNTLRTIMDHNQREDHHEDRMLAHADKMLMNAQRIEAMNVQNETTPTKKADRATIIELIKDPSMAPLIERYGELAPDPGETDGSRPG